MSRSPISLSRLGQACDVAALSAAQSRRWSPGLAAPAHSEVFAGSDTGCGVALALALARDGLSGTGHDPLGEGEDRRHVLWVQDAATIRLTGRPYRHGLPRSLRERLIHVAAKSPEDALFALEEGLRCRDFAFVIGEMAGNPKALDFTASRRLSLAAEKHGVPLWLVRLDASADLSSARMRWRVEAAASSPARWDEAAPGQPAWRVELFRARMHAPGEWILHDDDGRLAAVDFVSQLPATPDHGDMARATVGRSLAAL